MSTFFAILLALWSTRYGEEPTRLECWRRLVAADEPHINPIVRGS
jgi:peptidoglycan/LPS O-acetylase OafA/YrhL